MEPTLKKCLEDVALSIRSLSMDAIQKANSGHPGLPMGCAEIGAALYGSKLKFHPKHLDWANRDRFVLSAGHGSMLLYSLLHLSGCGLSMEEIQNFRQLHSKTPGHPEVYETPGVEMTTGPLGQGLAASVGMALAGKILASRFNTEDHTIFDYKVYALAGDGCVMEGIAHEACSFAGHNGLDNLVVLYDANDICLDGPLEECFSEDVWKRFEAYGFEVMAVDGHSLEEVSEALDWTGINSGCPKLIICKTTIGKGSVNKAGTSSVHGSPLGEEEIKLTKKNLGLNPEESFVIQPSVQPFFEAVHEVNDQKYQHWLRTFEDWKEKNPELFSEYESMCSFDVDSLESEMPKFTPGDQLAGRKSSQACLQVLGQKIPGFVGGSADLSCSDSTAMKDSGFLNRDQYAQRNIKYGVREFGMSGIAAGMALSGSFIPYVGTFLTFSDYLRPSLRLSSLIGLRVIYQFTHDSVFLGEDGPTHQPVEHAAALRTIPNTLVFRPADGNEVRSSWLLALQHQGPSAILLSRQNVPHLKSTDLASKEGVARGAYVVKEVTKSDYVVIYSSGTELHMALEAAEILEKEGIGVKVVSVPCFELFEKQSPEYKNSILSKDARHRVAIEAQVSLGWHRFVGIDGQILGVDRFGMSAPLKDIQNELGFTPKALADSVRSALKAN